MPNTLVVAVDVPNTEDWVVAAPNIDPELAAANIELGCVDAAANTDDGDGGDGGDDANTDGLVVAPKADVVVGAELNRDGVDSLLNAGAVVVAPKSELDVVAGVPNIEPVPPKTLVVADGEVLNR